MKTLTFPQINSLVVRTLTQFDGLLQQFLSDTFSLIRRENLGDTGGFLIQ